MEYEIDDQPQDARGLPDEGDSRVLTRNLTLRHDPPASYRAGQAGSHRAVRIPEQEYG